MRMGTLLRLVRKSGEELYPYLWDDSEPSAIIRVGQTVVVLGLEQNIYADKPFYIGIKVLFGDMIGYCFYSCEESRWEEVK